MDEDLTRDLIEGMTRAHEIMGAMGPPPLEVQHDAFTAAERIGARTHWRRILADDGRFQWQAGLETARGTTWVDVAEPPLPEDADGIWRRAFCELGLLD